MTRDRLQMRPVPMLGLVVASTVLGLAGTDLVLPATPSLPEALGGDAAHAQLVLAAYVAGMAAGLIIYGELNSRYSTRTLFAGSLLATAAISLACAATNQIDALIAMRALQGAAAAGLAVFAPGIVKSLFDEVRAVRAMGVLGSIESLTPAVAPIIGAWLLTLGGWRLSFHAIGALALLLVAMLCLVGPIPQTARRDQGSYARLIKDPVFLRYALSQVCVLGGLLTFVFGMSAVFVRALDGDLADFIVMQVCGIATFMIAANVTGHIVARFGAERVVRVGTALAAVGAAKLEEDHMERKPGPSHEDVQLAKRRPRRCMEGPRAR